MSIGKCLRNFDDLPGRFLRTKIDRCTDRDCSHISSLVDSPEHHLIEFIWISEQFIVIDLNYERYLVRVFTSYRSKYTKGGGDRVTAAFDRQLNDIFGIKVIWIWCKARSSRVLNTLIDRQDRNITRVGQPPCSKDRLQTSLDSRASVGLRD